jgi:lipoprotein-anchoring transpeptidase ErfK/SrfK
VKPISAAAQTEMDRVNAATDIAMPQRPALEAMAEPDAAMPEEPSTLAPQIAAAPQTEASVATNVRYDAGLVRLQVLLDRAHISPGVIDGYDGDNVRKAISEYQARHDLAVTGVADTALLAALGVQDAAPALVTYTIADADVAGPFVDIPTGLEAMSRLDRLSFENPTEALAEKFHMDVDLLALLNPGANFAEAGTEIVVANAGGELGAPVASIDVDKRAGAVRAFDAAGALLAYYPASIGSSDAPAPSGDYAVRAVAFNPIYNYDPARLPTFGQTGHGALSIAAGPNSPVGLVWIALTLDTYGIHGTPNPSQVSKTQSHGCVRLTNWDATELGHAVRQGVPVRFTDGQRQAASAAARAPT